MIGITDLDRVSVELFERFLFRFRAHPVELLDSRAIRRLEISDELLDFRFRFRRKIFCAVKLAHAEAHRAEGAETIADSEITAADCGDGAFPTSFFYLLAGKSFVVELEIRRRKRCRA